MIGTIETGRPRRLQISAPKRVLRALEYTPGDGGDVPFLSGCSGKSLWTHSVLCGWLERFSSRVRARISEQSRATSRAVELTAILVRRGAHGSQEGATHRICTAESAGGSDLFEALVRSFQLPARCFGSHLQDIMGWRFSQLAGEYALEIPNAHCATVCQLLYGQIVWKVFRNPNLKLMNGLHFRCLGRQGSA